MKNTISNFLFVLVGLGLTAAPATLFAPPPHSGIQGQASLYISAWLGDGPPPPISPGDVQFPVGTSFTLVAARSGREVARVTTDASGVFKVSLHPGKYILIPDTLVINPFLD